MTRPPSAGVRLSVEARLARLEVDVGRILQLGGDRVAARAFYLVDEEGRICARLAVTPNGPALSLSALQGEARAILTAGPAGSGLILTDAQGESRAAVGVLEGEIAARVPTTPPWPGGGS